MGVPKSVLLKGGTLMMSYKNHLKDYVLWLTVITVVLWSSVASGQSQIQVPTAEYPTIEAAVLAAQPGDEVVVADGTYSGKGNVRINFAEKAIVLRSANGPEACIIDGEGSAPAFLFNKDTAGMEVDGFTIQNGQHSYGGAVYCGPSSAPTIKNCIFDSNNASYGGAVACRQASPTFINCVMTRNSAGNGGAMFIHASDPRLIHCTLYANSTKSVAPGISCMSSTPLLVNSILWNDHSLDVKEIELNSGLEPYVIYSDVRGGWDGEGNLDSDPLFSGYDVHLLEGSPCLDAGTSGVELGLELPEFDFEGDSRVCGQAPDMGADESVTKTVSVIPVEIDIKPFGHWNIINLRSRRVVPVAVLTTDAFQKASDIDLTSVDFGGAQAVHWKFKDVDRDGDDDLLLFFEAQALNLSKDSADPTLTLSGKLMDGTEFVGTDDVRMVPSRKCKGKLKNFKEKKLRTKAKRWRR
jgi:hypothetical protein